MDFDEKAQKYLKAKTTSPILYALGKLIRKGVDPKEAARIVDRAVETNKNILN